MTKPFETITLGQVARLPRPGMAVPGAYRFTPGGDGILYLHSSEGTLVRSLWRYDIATGERRELAGPGAPQQMSREEELRRERERIVALGVTGYAVAATAATPTIMIPGAPLIRVLVGDEPAREVAGTEGALAPAISPDGARIAFVRDGELHVVDTTGNGHRVLTSGAEDGLTHGLAEFIAQEELDRSQGFWWSPDSTLLAFIEADERHIPRMPIVHQGKDDLDIEYHRYPFAGDANARLRVGIADATGSDDVRWLDLGQASDDFYIPHVAWRPDGALAVQVLSRDQQGLSVLLFDASGTRVAELREASKPWLNIDHSSRFLASGELLWTSERSGFRHLYLYDATLQDARQLTGGDWVVTRIVGVDEDAGLAYFEATRDGVRERHLYRIPLSGGEVERLTTEPGWHSTVLSRDARWFIDSHSSLAHAPVTSLCSTVGGAPVTLWANEGASAHALGLEPPELTEVAAEDGTSLHVALYHPPAATAPHPAIVSVYGGPHAQRVMDDWSLTVDLRAQYLARQGFLVVKVDNRGSANRGLAFEGALDRRMGTVEVDDQATVVRELARRGLADVARVGIYGWSYGGYMTCMSMARESDLFRVGVAGAPVTHWDGYDTAYTERYMGTPAENPEGYSDGAVMTHVASLRGKLLLVHGLVDENVHFRHTARLITALNAAQKPYDLLVYPEERHVPRDAAGLEYQERRLAGYFREHL